MKIAESLQLRNIRLKNRIVMPPMATAKADEKGHVTKEILEYYHEKTKDQLFSIVITEHSFVEPIGRAHKNQTSIAEDSCIEGMSQLAKVIQGNHSLAILQISHAGSTVKSEEIGTLSVGPSAIQNPTKKNEEIPKELSVEEIEGLIEKFIAAAIRAKKAGFDGIEIHSAHGYLLNQFLSPLSNQRKDAYGGGILGRIKIHLEIIKRIREELGEDYLIFLRMGAGDFMEGGLSIEDAVIAAKEFEKAGVDVLDISGGMCRYSIEDTRPGYFDCISKPIFENVQIPVILTGGVQRGQDIEDILKREVCDLVGVGRAVYKNSNWLREEVFELFQNSIARGE